MFEFLKKIIKNKKLQNSLVPNERLYVLTNNKLASVYAAVQGAHVVAQWLIEHPKQQWNNQYLIFLKCDIAYALKNLEGQDYSVFYEEDLNSTPTAIAILATKENIVFLKTLKLLE